MGRSVLLVLGLLVLACGGDRGYHVHGEVKNVLVDEKQVVIAHEDIPGLMPAMTMNFDVADPALLEGLEPGLQVEFTLLAEEGRYRITEIAPLAAGSSGGGGSSGGAKLDPISVRDPAGAFALVDQNGDSLSLADLAGQAVVLDFIFTRCPGPCPILTGIVRDLQQALPAGQRARTRFVSISIDPLVDTPPVLREYARKRKLDLSDWSFLTGDEATIQAVLDAYGVGTVRAADGTINHLVAIFLIDPEGRIAARYIGLEHGPDTIARDLARVLS